MQNTHHECFGFLHMLRQDQRAQRRRHRERRNQTAGQRIGIGLRHRAEDMSLDSAQGKQRNEACDNDAGGKEYGAVHICRGVKDREPLAMQPGRRKRPDGFFARLLIAVSAQPAEYAFDHDDRCVHDQSEIDGADRQ